MRRCLTKDAARAPARHRRSAPRAERDRARDVVAASASGARPRDVPSLAVLYFENLASDAESEYFCAGITEDILTDLSKIKGLRVASRNAVARYRGAPVDIAEGRRRAGRAARCSRAACAAPATACASRRSSSTPPTGSTSGPSATTARSQDVFAVQEEIASSIAEALRVALSPAEAAAIGEDRPERRARLRSLPQGPRALRQYTTSRCARRSSCSSRRSPIDPSYALAWAGVADCYGQLLPVELPTERARRDARAWGSRRRDARSRSTRGSPRRTRPRRWCCCIPGDREGSRAALRRALEVNPRFTPALINLGGRSLQYAATSPGPSA